MTASDLDGTKAAPFLGRRVLPLTLLSLAMLLVGGSPASAHPHVWVDADAELIFEEGAIEAVRVRWTFDPITSADAIAGFDRNADRFFDTGEQEDLQAALEAGTAASNYYTHVRVDDAVLPVSEIQEFTAAIVQERVSYTFLARLPHPVDPWRHSLNVALYDEEFYLAFEYLQPPAVLAGGGADDCAFSVREDADHPIYYGLFRPKAIDVRCGPREQVAASGSSPSSGTDGGTRRESPDRSTSWTPGFLHGAFDWMLAAQSSIHALLAARIGLAAAGSAAILPSLIIIGMAFLYGVLHAVGPGHGKVVVAAYLAGQSRPRIGAAALMGASIAMLQALAAIAVVGALVLAFGTARLGRVDDIALLELISYGLIAGIGIVMIRGAIIGRPSCGHDHSDHHADGHQRPRHDTQALAGIWPATIAAGMRPCTGAILVLLFTVAQGVFVVGVLAVLAMGVGSALTVSAIGMGAVGARRSMSASAGRRPRLASAADAAFTLGAPFVLVGFSVLMAAGAYARL